MVDAQPGLDRIGDQTGEGRDERGRHGEEDARRDDPPDRELDREEAVPDTAEALIWRAIVLSTDAKVSGGLAARGKVAEARRLLLKAESLNPTAMDGSIPASLGSLYANVPGWPLSYGDKKKAAEYLKAALAIDPDNINTLFFLGELRHKQGDNAAARASFEKALATPPRSGREVADAGRRREELARVRSIERGQLQRHVR